MDEQLNIRDLTVDEMLDRYLILVTSRNSPQPNADTTVSPELIDTLIQRYEEWHGRIPKEFCYFDPESNSIRPGIKHRT